MASDALPADPPEERSVDLSTSSRGIITFRNGVRFWCPIVHDDKDGFFSVRYAHDAYREYHKDGTRRDRQWKKWDIVEFRPCTDDDAESRRLPMNVPGAW